jgi:hypothetical protein
MVSSAELPRRLVGLVRDAVGSAPETGRRVFIDARARVETLRRTVGMLRNAVGPDGPLRAAVEEAWAATEETLEVLRSGELDRADLERLRAAADRAEEAIGRVSLLAMVPGPIGQTARIAGAARSALRTWREWLGKIDVSGDRKAGDVGDLPEAPSALPATSPEN